MENVERVVAIATGLLSLAYLGYFCWRLWGDELRAWWKSILGAWIERRRDLATIRRMWGADA